MYFRYLTVAIVAFWIVMTGLLVQSVYFPESNRFAAVDPKHVAELFFENTDFQTLSILEDGKEIAEVTLSGKKLGRAGEAAEAGEDEPTGPEGYELRCTVTGILELSGIPPQRLTTRFLLSLDEDFAFGPFHLSLFLHREKSRIDVFHSKETGKIDFRVIKNGVTVAESMEDDKSLPRTQEVAAITEMLGLGNPDQAEKTMREIGEALKLKARRCRIDLGRSHHAPGFLISLDLLESEGVKLYFTEAGELIKAETALGIELVADTLVRDDASAPSAPSP